MLPRRKVRSGFRTRTVNLLKREEGFTLFEVLIIAIIIGILSTFAYPSYIKMIETEKATTAVGMLQPIGAANKMNNLRGGAYLTGAITAAHAIVTDGMIPNDDWAGLEYDFHLCDPAGGAVAPCCENNLTACAKRKTGPGSPYDNWGYTIDVLDAMAATGGAPDPYSGL